MARLFLPPLLLAATDAATAVAATGSSSARRLQGVAAGPAVLCGCSGVSSGNMPVCCLSLTAECEACKSCCNATQWCAENPLCDLCTRTNGALGTPVTYVNLSTTPASATGADCAAPPLLAASVTRLRMTVGLAIESIPPGSSARTTFLLNFKSGLATLLLVPASSVRVERLIAGSAVITVTIQPIAVGQPVNTTLLTTAGATHTIAGYVVSAAEVLTIFSSGDVGGAEAQQLALPVTGGDQGNAVKIATAFGAVMLVGAILGCLVAHFVHARKHGLQDPPKPGPPPRGAPAAADVEGSSDDEELLGTSGSGSRRHHRRKQHDTSSEDDAELAQLGADVKILQASLSAKAAAQSDSSGHHHHHHHDHHHHHSSTGN